MITAVIINEKNEDNHKKTLSFILRVIKVREKVDCVRRLVQGETIAVTSLCNTCGDSFSDCCSNSCADWLLQSSGLRSTRLHDLAEADCIHRQ